MNGVEYENMQDMRLIAQGAEARLYKGIYLGMPCLMKERFVKNYRHPELDTRLTRERIRAESRAILRAKAAGIPTPAVYRVSAEGRSIYLEDMVNTVMLKSFIDKDVSGRSNVDHLLEYIGRELGAIVARLHSNHIIHGDLTTSNILLETEKSSNELSVNETGDKNRFILIDFGLARVDCTPEDKAVDLYVLERSLLSAHSEVPTLFSRILHHYQLCYENKNECKQILSKYKEVQARGRKRLMIG